MKKVKLDPQLAITEGMSAYQLKIIIKQFRRWIRQLENKIKFEQPSFEAPKPFEPPTQEEESKPIEAPKLKHKNRFKLPPDWPNSK